MLRSGLTGRAGWKGLERDVAFAYGCLMSKVEQIETDIAKLSATEARQVAQWLQEFLADEWDKEIETDAKAGKLDFLFDEGTAERRAGSLREWPSDSK